MSLDSEAPLDDVDIDSMPQDPDAADFERGDQVEMAVRMLGLLRRADRDRIVGDESALHGYNPKAGLWLPVTREEQSRVIQNFAGSSVAIDKKPLRVRAPDVHGALSLAYDREAKPGYFSDAPAGLAFTNGFVSVSDAGVTLAAHSPDHRARFGYAFDYAGNAPAPLFLRFLGEIFRDDVDRDEKIAALQEHAGASLVGIATTYQRCIVAVGGGDEGKSTHAKIVGSAFPPGSTEAIPPQEWGQEYRRAMLAGKLLNVVAELPESDIIASEAFKAVITGDPITGRHIRQSPFTFKPRAGHLFLANRLPGSQDQTRGFWRRFIVIRFNRCFTGDAARDPHIADKIIAAEKPRIVSWALQGAARLMAQRDYTIPSSHAAELSDWRRNADQIATFTEERTSPAPDASGTPASAVYTAYRVWAENNGHRPVSATKLGLRLRELGHPAEKTRTGNVYPLTVQGCSLSPRGGLVEGCGANPSRDSDKDPNAYN